MQICLTVELFLSKGGNTLLSIIGNEIVTDISIS